MASPLRPRRPRRPRPRTLITAMNPNHHLWLHGKNWWVYCAVNPTPRTKDKLRRSLCTEDVKVARFRRDELFRALHAAGMLGRIRALPLPRSVAVCGPEVADLTWQKRADIMLAEILSITPMTKKLPGTVVGTGKGKLQVC